MGLWRCEQILSAFPLRNWVPHATGATIPLNLARFRVLALSSISTMLPQVCNAANDDLMRKCRSFDLSRYRKMWSLDLFQGPAKPLPTTTYMGCTKGMTGDRKLQPSQHRASQVRLIAPSLLKHQPTKLYLQTDTLPPIGGGSTCANVHQPMAAAVRPAPAHRHRAW